MDRNREVRRVPMAAGGNGLSRRRYRAGGSFRDSPEEGPVEVPETTRLRDRGGSMKKERDRERERDRLSSRSKRRRGVHGNLDDGGDDSSEESVNDDEEYDDGGGGGGSVRPSTSSSLKMLPPVNISPASFSSSLPNHHNTNGNLHHHNHQRKSSFPPTKVFRSTNSPASFKAVDEMIGVAVPRKARSACTKRPHESWSSSVSNGAVFASGEQINRTSPSPSSSNVSIRKKLLSGSSKQKPLPPKSCKLPSPVAIQDEIEIEIAEVLYGMNRMPLAISKQESATNDLREAEVKSQTCNVSATAPRRKKPRHVKYDDENSTNFSNIKSESEAPLKSQLPFGKRPGSADENSSVLDQTNPQPSTAARESNASLDSAEKKEINVSKDDTILPKVESSPGFRSEGDETKSNSPEKKMFEIDLMEAKPLLKEEGCDVMILESEEKKKPRMVAEAEPQKTEINCELKLDLEKSDPVAAVESKHHIQKQSPQQQLSVSDKTAQGGPFPPHMSLPGWPGGLPTMGYMPPTRGVVSTDTGSLSSAAMQPPLHLLFNQPKPKRCATHCYIARNIQSHQQFTKMNPFWPAAGGSAPLYGTKACNVSLMTPTDLQGSVLGRSSNPVPDKNSQSTSKSSDTAQRNQILLQQALPPGAAMHGPTFIFPLGQQPHGAATIAATSVRPNNGNTASSGVSTTPNLMNGSASANPAGAQTMSFSYPGNETQYLAILQNNGYPFPVPAHVGAPPAYRGAPGQPMPFFNGSFYSSQMMQPPHLQQQKQQQQQQQQPGQMLQSHSPSNQNGNVSAGSTAAQKHLQLRPQINHGNSQGFPTHKVQSQPLSFQQRQQPRENATQHSETAQEVRPSTADSRASQSSAAYVQNYGMQMQPTNMGLMSSATPGVVVRSSSNHGETKSQQQGSKASMESFQSQGYAMTFNGANNAPALNMSSIAQNHPMFHRIPEAARQGYQMMAVAQQKMNYNAPLEDGRSGSNASASATEERRKTGGGATAKTSGVNGGQSIAFSNKHDLADASAVTSGSIVDSSSRLLNLCSALPPSSNPIPTSHQQQQQQHHMQRNQSQQPYTNMYLQKQQQYATSVAASAARTKAPVASNRSGFPDHNITASPKFPQNLIQSSSNQVQQSPQWKTNSPMSQSPSMLSPSSSVGAASSLRNASHKQQSRPQQSQISFAANSKPMASGSPMQQNQAGSPSTSSISKTAGGSSKATTSASSAVNKAGQASSQPSKNSQSASVATGSKSQQQQPKHGLQPQGQLFFSNPFMQPPGGYYIQRHQQQSVPATATGSPSQVAPSTTGAVTATSDPAKAIAAAAAAMGKTVQQHQLVVPPGFPYAPSAIQVKPVDQKQQAGE